MCLAVGVIGIFPDFGKVVIYYLIFPLCFAKDDMVLGSFLENAFKDCFRFMFHIWYIWILSFYIVYQVSVIKWCRWFYCFYNVVVFQVIVIFVIVINVFPYPIDCCMHPWRCNRK